MKRLICLWILALTLAGCSRMLSNVKPNYMLDKTKEKSLVIGRIEIKGYRQLCQRMVLYLMKNEDKKYYSITVNESSLWEQVALSANYVSLYFFVELPSGTYKITEIAVGNWKMWPKFCINIPTDPSITYVGTLEAKKSGRTNFSWWGDSTSQVLFSVNNDKEEAIAELRKRYPSMKEDVRVNLMEKCP